ncbi:fas-binding factor 1-like [Adelges cooleyi]|uniref:fas-binding factor 1-like n=1 Tax=Adelges cooleyi TaxID=133065 RepID=UPI00218054F9|nr:fas-binding factor 1-like [Adelges cooleyi]
MTGTADNWDVLDDLLANEDGDRRKDLDKPSSDAQLKPTVANTGRSEDWLGLRTPSTDMVYEPSLGGSSKSRRNNLSRQTTHRTSRSAGLLFDDDDEDDYNGGGFARDIIGGDNDKTITSNKKDGRPLDLELFQESKISVTEPVLIRLPTPETRPRRRETSPTIAVTNDMAQKSSANKTDKMPPWLSGLIQKDESPQPASPPRVTQEVKQNISEVIENNKINVNPTPTIVSLLEGKDNLQTSILEFIQELAKKKQDIQQATITLIQDQQNSDLLIKALLMDNSAMISSDSKQLECLQSENKSLQLTIDHLTKIKELELDTIKTKYELELEVLRDKLNRYESRIRELDEERKKDSIEQKQNEMLLKQSFEDRLRTIHESHLIDLKQSAEVQKIKMSHLEEVESSLRDTKSKRSMNSDEMSAREMSIITQERKLKDLQEEVDKQLAVLDGEKASLQVKMDEFQSRYARERSELEVASKELKRSMAAFESSRKSWEREKKSDTQYIESRKQELEAVRSSVMEEQRKLAEERFEVASERCRLETMLKMDTGNGSDLIRAKAELKESFNNLREKEKDLEKLSESLKEHEKHLVEEKHKLAKQDDDIKIKLIRAEKLLKLAMAKQEEGFKALESAKNIQSRFDKKGKDIENRLFDVIRREENVLKDEKILANKRDDFDKQRKRLDLILPHLSADEMYLSGPKINKCTAENEAYYRKTQLY